MKLELKQIELPEMPEEYKNAHDMIQNVMSRHLQEIAQKREDQILQKLSEHGYTFKHKSELEHFAKTRCVLEKYDNQLRILRVDGKIICEWWETSRFEQKENVMTVIVGEPPAYS